MYDLRPHDWQRKTSGLDLEFTFTWILDFLLRVRKSWSVNWFPINMYSFRILKLTGQDMIHFVYFEILIRTRILFTVNDNLLRRFVWKFLAVWERFLMDRRGPIHDLQKSRNSRNQNWEVNDTVDHVSHSSRDDGRMKSVHHVARESSATKLFESSMEQGMTLWKQISQQYCDASGKRSKWISLPVVLQFPRSCSRQRDAKHSSWKQLSSLWGVAGPESRSHPRSFDIR